MIYYWGISLYFLFVSHISYYLSTDSLFIVYCYTRFFLCQASAINFWVVFICLKRNTRFFISITLISIFRFRFRVKNKETKHVVQPDLKIPYAYKKNDLKNIEKLRVLSYGFLLEGCIEYFSQIYQILKKI